MDAVVEAALQARQYACAPYSGFQVGAALEDDSGRVWTGCNVENASYGLSVCAERVALLKALSEGARRFRRIAIATGARSLTPPCGACRQLLWEYCGDLEIVLVSTQGTSETLSLRALLPRPFDASNISC